MIVYNGIFCCERDNRFAEGHARQLDTLGRTMRHCLYYGRQGDRVAGMNSEALQIDENYENLPVKTMCMLKHAMQFNWDVFLKTDVNACVASIKWDVVEVSHLTGFVSYKPVSIGPGKNCKSISQKALLEPCLAPTPKCWMGGPAYTLSRELAAMIVIKGAWWARQFWAEDQMVALIAEECGITPVPAIGYIADDGRLDVNK